MKTNPAISTGLVMSTPRLLNRISISPNISTMLFRPEASCSHVLSAIASPSPHGSFSEYTARYSLAIPIFSIPMSEI